MSGTRVTEPERREIQRLSLLEGLTARAIAKQLGRDRDTINAVLRSPDTAAFKEQLADENAQAAIRHLREHGLKSAMAWTRSVEVAADKGRHEPARDLLLHTKIVEPVDRSGRDGSHVQVVLGLALPGTPAYVAKALEAATVDVAATNGPATDDEEGGHCTPGT